MKKNNTLERNNPLINPKFLAKARKIEFSESEKVTDLNLSGFQLKGKATVSGFPNLKILNLSVNELTDLEINEDSVANLEVVNLCFNNLNNLRFLKQVKSDLIKSLILNDNFLHEVKMGNFYSMLNLVELNLSNQINSAGEKVKNNSFVFDITNDQGNFFLARLASGLNIDNTEIDLLDLDFSYLGEFSKSEIEISLWKSYKWYFFSTLFLLILFFIYLIMKKIWKKIISLRKFDYINKLLTYFCQLLIIQIFHYKF